MNDIKLIVAKNISQLRQKKGMTQMELAEKLNYSDKAVSKWERGESLPDIGTLVDVADLFGVSLDYLVRLEHKEEKKPKTKRLHKYNRGLIVGMSMLLVWLVALFVFVLISLISSVSTYHWLVFIYAVPTSMIVWLTLSSIWFRSRYNYIAISIMMWSALASLHLSILPLGKNIWLIYLLGIPAQIIIIMWSKIKLKHREKIE